MAKITVTVQEKVLKEIPLSKDRELTIGRDPSNDLQLDNPAVSRFHAKIYKAQWPYYVEDLKSTNGTYLNGARINWKDALKNNDKITIGKYTLIYNDSPVDYEEKKRKFDPSSTIKMSRR